MTLFEPHEWSFVENARDLVTTNPFHSSWRDKECALLGQPARESPEVIAYRPGVALWGPQSVYSEELHRRITELCNELRRRLENGWPANEAELRQYELLSIYCLYCNYGEKLDRFISAAVQDHTRKRAGDGRTPRKEPPPEKKIWKDFQDEHSELFTCNRGYPQTYPREHLFACFFLFRRAFYQIFFNIIGTSKPIANLRCAVWESIVTHDLLSWMQGLYERMNDSPTLIIGPSGTGKERVAEAIGRSVYIPFDTTKKSFKIDFPDMEKEKVENDFLKAFNPVNISALSPQLIESELFGHVEGAFTGAVRNRIGRLEMCKLGAVFLDEIGELTEGIQVKLLRVLQDRRFQPVGACENKEFLGKIIAATNRDLNAEMQAGRFRPDLYYRICADKIETPSLREQLADRPEDLSLFVQFVCRNVMGEDRAAEFAPKVVEWIEQNLGGYAWPGNFRELEQCVRSYTIRKTYHRARPRTEEAQPLPPSDAVAGACKTLAEAVLDGKMTYEDTKRRLFTLVRRGTPTSKEAARRLGLRDYRTLNRVLEKEENSLGSTEM